MVVGKYEPVVVRVAALCWARVTMVAAGPGKFRQQASVSPALAVTAGTYSEDTGQECHRVVCCISKISSKCLMKLEYCEAQANGKCLKIMNRIVVSG